MVRKLSEAQYLFCFAKNDRVDQKTLGKGLTSDQSLLKVPVKDLAAIVSTVSLEEFAGPGSEDRLNNVEWVAPRALRHGQIVQEVNQVSPVFPVSFGSLFSSVDKLTSFVKSNYETISSFLDEIEGSEEWSVKAYLDRENLKKRIFDEKIRHAEHELSKLSPGVRYFKEKQIHAEVDKEISTWVNSRISHASRELESVTARLLERKNTKLAFDENDHELVANWAILALERDFEKIESIVSMINNDPDFGGMELKLTGPWSPYTFVPTLESEEVK